MTPEVIKTNDGSVTLYIKDLNETYHSLFGALTESEHIYIKSGLFHRYNQGTFDANVRVRVFEVGFGTGLNALLSLKSNIPIYYTSIEKYPLEPNIVSQLNYGNEKDLKELYKLHQAKWDEDVHVNENFTLHKCSGDFLDTEFDKSFDVIFMDAFAPEKQPEMWSKDILSKLAGILSKNGILTTYCAKGCVRRGFKDAGLYIERLAGPPGGKREIIRATKRI